MRRELLVVSVVAACSAGDDRTSAVEEPVVACAHGSTIKGVDVSYYEPSIDWARARADGIEFAFIRVSDGLSFLDPKFASHWAGAKAAGVIRGAYQFFRPAEDPIAQADLLLAHMGPLEAGDLPPVIDVEVDGGLAPDAVAASVRAWVARVTAALGRPPIIYAGLYSWHDLTGNADLTASPLWVAQWTSAACPDIPTPWQSWMFWQYSATDHVAGIDGETLDVNVYDGTRDDLLAFAVGGTCGDGACNSGESTLTCDVDCPPCGTVGPAGGEIDDGDDCFATGGPAEYLRAVEGDGEGDDLIWTHTTADDTEGNFADWTLNLAEAGTYRVEVYTAAAHARSHHAAYVVTAAGGAAATVVVDQTAVDGWQTLGDFAFAARGGQAVHLADNTGEAGATDTELAFDAVRLTRLDAPPGGDGDDDGQATAGCNAADDSGTALVIALAILLPWRLRRRAR